MLHLRIAAKLIRTFTFRAGLNREVKLPRPYFCLFLSCRTTFLQVGDPLVQRGEGGLHSAALLRLVAHPQLPLLDAVYPGQHLLLQVVDPALEQIFQAVCLRRLVTSADLLSGEAFWVNGPFWMLLYLILSLVLMSNLSHFPCARASVRNYKPQTFVNCL